jgi:hypothetical protein
MNTIETTDTIIDDNASGGANSPLNTFVTDAIIALGADGFTVDDGGSDGHPNANGIVYNYLCLG